METEVIVLGVSRYSFPDQKTGEIIEGTKVHYVEKDAQNEDNTIGFNPTTANMPYKYFDEIKAVPAVYKAKLKVMLSGRKPTLKIEGFQYVSSASFNLAK